jgi:hypothetical protein
VIAQARDRAIAECDAAIQHIGKRQGVQAEDALIRSIAFSHWAREPLGRAVAFMMLGQVERHLLKYPNETVSAFFIGIDLLESLLQSSKTAAAYFEPTVEELAKYLEELGDSKRAK